MKRFRLILGAASIALLTAATMILIRGMEVVPPSLSFDDVLLRDRLRAALHEPGDTVSLDALMRDAKRVCVVMPYQSEKQVSARLGTSAPDLDWTMSDGLWGLALVVPKGVRVVKSFRDIDFAGDRGACWDEPYRLNAVLVSTMQEDGRDWWKIDIRERPRSSQ